MRRRRYLTAACAAVLAAAAASQSSSSAQARCNEQTPTGTVVDCFSGPYHGTGYLSFYDTMAFKRIPAAQLHANPLWQAWLDDMRRNHTSRPCADKNAITYVGSFTFYGRGTFIACSERVPSRVSGFYKLTGSYHLEDEMTTITMTRGALSGAIGNDNVIELIFSDPGHHHYANPEVVRGVFRG